MEDLALLFCSSADTNSPPNQANLGVTRYQTKMDAPLAVEHSLETLYLSLRSFTFTNYFYNSLKSFCLSLGVEYTNYYRSETKETLYRYACQEGYFNETGFQQQFLNGMVNEKGDVPAGSNISFSSLGYTPYGTQDGIPTTFDSMIFQERNGKFTFHRDPFDFYLREDEVKTKTAPCIPIKFMINIVFDSIQLLESLGLFRSGDVVQDEFGKRQIQVPLSYTKTRETIGGVKYFHYFYTEVNYEFPYPAYLRPLDYIDVRCDNVESTHYSSNLSQLSMGKTLARIPILSEFGQTQTYYPKEISYIPIMGGTLSQFMITLNDAKNEVNMQKSPFLCELGVSIKRMEDISEAKGNVDEMTYMPPVLASSRMTQDNLDFPQNQPLTSLQRNIYGENKQGREAKRMRRPYI